MSDIIFSQQQEPAAEQLLHSPVTVAQSPTSLEHAGKDQLSLLLPPSRYMFVPISPETATVVYDSGRSKANKCEYEYDDDMSTTSSCSNDDWNSNYGDNTTLFSMDKICIDNDDDGGLGDDDNVAHGTEIAFFTVPVVWDDEDNNEWDGAFGGQLLLGDDDWTTRMIDDDDDLLSYTSQMSSTSFCADDCFDFKEEEGEAIMELKTEPSTTADDDDCGICRVSPSPSVQALEQREPSPNCIVQLEETNETRTLRNQLWKQSMKSSMFTTVTTKEISDSESD